MRRWFLEQLLYTKEDAALCMPGGVEHSYLQGRHDALAAALDLLESGKCDKEE